MSLRYDVAVVGAGVFGAWTAWHLTRRGKRVLLLDAYGPANARASSAGGGARPRLAVRAGRHFFATTQRQELFHQTGVLWLAAENDERFRETTATLARCGVRFETLDAP